MQQHQLLIFIGDSAWNMQKQRKTKQQIQMSWSNVSYWIGIFFVRIEKENFIIKIRGSEKSDTSKSFSRTLGWWQPKWNIIQTLNFYHQMSFVENQMKKVD